MDLGDHRPRGAARAAPTRATLTPTVRVAVDAVGDRPDRTFEYRVPPGSETPAPGSVLLVPYGRQLALGYAMPSSGGGERSASEFGDELRSIETVVSGPILTDELLALAERISAYYRSPLGMTIAGMLPAGLEARLQRRWEVADIGRLPQALSGAVGADATIGDRELRRGLRGADGTAALERLRRTGVVRAAWTLRQPEGRPTATRTIVGTSERAAEATPVRGPLQRALLQALEPQPQPLHDLAAALSVTASQLLEPARALERRGLAELGWRSDERDALAHRPIRTEDPHALAAEQTAARDAFETLPRGGEMLLEGVAASGKTDVYLRIVESALARGEGSIVLVPEISLVTQLADRLRATFGTSVAVLHSGLTPGERHDTWWRVLRSETAIVVGTRMAVFAPLSRLGAIVVDEEHDASYKQDRTPRYDARWVARERAALSGARVVLGSATPDMVTYERARAGRASRVCLTGRRAGAAPSVELVDMRAELAAGERSIFSRPLQSALTELRPGLEQAILLINRRGASTFVLCRDCGYTLRCPECDLPFVFHLDGGVLRCHHCGRTAEVPSTCPSCGSVRIRYFGAGTQRVEAELLRILPSLRVGRLDSDVIARRRGYESVYDRFRDGLVDVLVGTQMVAKGLDLPRVTLAGVIAADVTLNLPDYRAAERTFQLVAQVAGRAGRGAQAGRVLVQTYAPDHYALRSAAELDVDAFAAEELPRRRLLGYPPFSVLARIGVSDPDRARAEDRAATIRDAVSVKGVDVLGPLPAYVPRRAGRWLMQVVVRAPDADSRGAALEQVPPAAVIDVDPESLL
ncbi:MAG: primosomal protein N' [Candidatus Limnocylindria bacterium]